MVAKMIFLNKNLQEEKRKQIKLCGILLQIEAFFEVTIYSYVFANKASQSETKIENKYCQCKINIFKHLVFRKLCTMFTQCSHEHECTC